MQIPIPLVATAIGAGTLGYYMGRKCVSSTVSVVPTGCGGNQDDEEEHLRFEDEAHSEASSTAAVPGCLIPAFLARQQTSLTATGTSYCSIPAFLAKQTLDSASWPGCLGERRLDA